MPVHGATVCWLYWWVLHIKSSKITSCNGWLASVWLLNLKPVLPTLTNSFQNSTFCTFFQFTQIFWWETHLELLQIEQRKAFKKSLNFSPNLQKFFPGKVSAGPIGFLAKYENAKGISKIHLSLFRHFAAFFYESRKTKKVFRRRNHFRRRFPNFFKSETLFFLL